MHKISIVVLFVILGSSILLGQAVSPASIQGSVTDEQNKPISGASVTLIRNPGTAATPAAPYSQTVKSSSNGGFLAQGLPPGTYTLCAQVPGDGFIDPCQWKATSQTAVVASGQTSTGNIIRMTKGSILKIRLQDPGNVASQNTKDGKNPAVLMGVWSQRGHFFHVHTVGKDAAGYNFQLTVPLDTPLSFQVFSQNLKLTDSQGVALASNASSTGFQHSSGDPNPKSFLFTVVGVNP